MLEHAGCCWTAETLQTLDITFNLSATPKQVIHVWLLDYERAAHAVTEIGVRMWRAFWQDQKFVKSPAVLFYFIFFMINIFIHRHSSWNSNFTAKVISQQPKVDSMIIFLFFSIMIILGMCQFSFYAWIKKNIYIFFYEYQYLIYCTFAYFWVLLYLTEAVWLVLLSHQCSQGENR